MISKAIKKFKNKTKIDGKIIALALAKLKKRK